MEANQVLFSPDDGKFISGDEKDTLLLPKHQIGDTTSLQISLENDELKQNAEVWNDKEQWQWTISLFIGTMLLYAQRTALPLCAVSVATEFGWDKAQTGLVLSCFFWGYTMTQIIGGYTSDKVGGDQVISMAMLVTGVITLITPEAAYYFDDKSSTLSLLILLRFFMGMSQAFHYPGMTSLMYKRAQPEDRSCVIGVVYASGYAGSVMSGSLGSILLEVFDWHVVFHVFGLAALAWALYVRTYMLKKQSVIVINQNGVNREKKRLNRNAEPIQWKKLLKHKAFWALLTGHFCGNYALGILLSWLPTFFTETFPGKKGWVFNVLPWLVAIPFSVCSGVLADKLISSGHSVGIARKLIHSISSILLIFPLFIVGFSSSFQVCIFLMMMAVSGQAFANGGIINNPNDIAPKNSGSVFGIMNTFGAISSFVGTYVAGYILHHTNSWAAVFMSAAGAILIGWVSFVLFGTGKRII
ncbi:solute carrier family 17 member 9-like [Anneissia japonica]|uniref:solute carrier family 17 member 9-like n=1 Tax=Anneissia japonica TaxID=1529436 RepID=UPI00142596C8|nr:solute carrier family 17 member 9-like [Anneissia japonica]